MWTSDKENNLVISQFNFRGAVKNTCKMLMALGLTSREVYEDDFEKPLLKESREFYRVCKFVVKNAA